MMAIVSLPARISLVDSSGLAPQNARRIVLCSCGSLLNRSRACWKLPAELIALGSERRAPPPRPLRRSRPGPSGPPLSRSSHPPSRSEGGLSLRAIRGTGGVQCRVSRKRAAATRTTWVPRPAPLRRHGPRQAGEPSNETSRDRRERRSELDARGAAGRVRPQA
jgi:hypothetical protein